MTTPTPEQLRAAAAHLARAVETMCSTSWEHVREAEECLPEQSMEYAALYPLTRERMWMYADTNIPAWLADAARWRLLIQAWFAEQQAAPESIWGLANIVPGQALALLEELMGVALQVGTSPAPAAGE